MEKKKKLEEVQKVRKIGAEAGKEVSPKKEGASPKNVSKIVVPTHQALIHTGD